MGNYTEYQAELQRAEADIANREEQIRQAQLYLQNQRAGLPQINARQLHPASNPMQSLLKRQQILSAASDIAQKEGIVSQYEQQLQPFKQQIGEAKQQIQSQLAEEDAFQAAQTLLDSGNPVPVSSLPPRVQYYYTELVKDKDAANASFEKMVSDFQTANPSEKVIADYKNMRIVGIQSGALGQTLSNSDYNKAVVQFNKELQQNSLKNINNQVSGIENKDITLNENIRKVDYNPFTAEMFPIVSAKTDINTINPATNKLYATVTPAPSRTERYKSAVAESGGEYVKGTLHFLGSESARREDIYQQKHKDFSQSEGMLNLAYAAPQVAIYASPVGTATFLVGGTESIIKAPTWQGKLQGAGEVALGAFGLKGELAGLRLNRELKAIENNPIKIAGFRVESSGGGVDWLGGSLQAGKTTYNTRLVQPYSTFSDTRTVLEGGQGITSRYSPGFASSSLTVQKFESGGVFNKLGKVNLVNEKIPEPYLFSNPIKTKQPLADVEAGYGRLYTKPIAEADLNVHSGFFGDKQYLTAQGKIVKLRNTPEYSNFVGIGKEENDFIKILGSKNFKGRYNLVTGEKSIILEKPDTIGIVRRINPNDFNTYATGEPSGMLKSKTRMQTPNYAESLMRQSMKDVALSQNVEKTTSANSLFGIRTSPATKTKNVFGIVQPTTTKNKNIFVAKEISGLAPKVKNTTKYVAISASRNSNKQVHIPRSELSLLPAEIQKQKTFLNTANRQAQKFQSRQMNKTFLNYVTPGKPKIKLPSFPFIQLPFNKKKPSKFLTVSGKNKFFAISKRYGKQIIVARGNNPRFVAETGRRYVLGTLGASLGLKTASGKWLSLNTDRIFRASKQKPYFIVQRKGGREGGFGRLASPGERREIKAARKFKWFL